MISNAEHISRTLWHQRLVKSKKAKEEHTESSCVIRLLIIHSMRTENKIKEEAFVQQNLPQMTRSQRREVGPGFLWLQKHLLVSRSTFREPQKVPGKDCAHASGQTSPRGRWHPQKLHSGEDGW